jgi:hypothetical protein
LRSLRLLCLAENATTAQAACRYRRAVTPSCGYRCIGPGTKVPRVRVAARGAESALLVTQLRSEGSRVSIRSTCLGKTLLHRKYRRSC